MARAQRFAELDTLVAVDSFARGIVKGELRQISVPIVELPDSAIEEGFMAEKYRHPDPADPHHGNLAFSTMMLGRTVDLLTRLGPGGTPAGLLSQLPELPDESDLNNCVDPDYFCAPAHDARKWIVQPDVLMEAILDHPDWISVEATTTVSGFAGLRIARAHARLKACERTGAINVALPSTLATAVSGMRVAVSALARSAENDRDTRYGLALSLSNGWSSGWRWFYTGSNFSGARFYCDIQRLNEGETLSLCLTPDTGEAKALAATEILSLAIGFCEN